MYCPFRKNVKKRCHPSTALIIEEDEYFMECYEHECMAYTNLDGCLFLKIKIEEEK